MRRTMTRCLILATGLMAGLSVSPPTGAAQITYSLSAVGSGELGGIPFADALVTITAIGDTALVTEFQPGILFNDVSASVAVAGIGTGTFTNDMKYVVNQEFQGVGLSDFGAGYGVLGILYEPTLATYELATALGPVPGLASYAPFITFPTTAGGFVMTSIDGIVFGGLATFQATTTAVPEPSTLALAGVGALGMVGLIRRRRHA